MIMRHSTAGGVVTTYLGDKSGVALGGEVSLQLSFQKTKQDFSTLWQAFSLGDVNKRLLLNQ